LFDQTWAEFVAQDQVNKSAHTLTPAIMHWARKGNAAAVRLDLFYRHLSDLYFPDDYDSWSVLLNRPVMRSKLTSYDGNHCTVRCGCHALVHTFLERPAIVFAQVAALHSELDSVPAVVSDGYDLKTYTALLSAYGRLGDFDRVRNDCSPVLFLTRSLPSYCSDCPPPLLSTLLVLKLIYVCCHTL
jgi:hypothetical protein